MITLTGKTTVIIKVLLRSDHPEFFVEQANLSIRSDEARLKKLLVFADYLDFAVFFLQL